MTIPHFEYFRDPVENGCVVEKASVCQCCQQEKHFMYVGPIYCVDDVSEVCPWCIADGSAAAKWSASFNDVYDVPSGVSQDVIETIAARTPGYSTWQDNKWLFSGKEALVFVGEVTGSALIENNEIDKISACREALSDWNLPKDFDLSNVVIGGQPAIYLFQDKETSEFHAYADMT
ncbi:CbrC family protein [Pseudovibrio sp. POLY-S9]|uniref:CbrC family protein n=1 Tax=Pseudovibrio sp. POLY-S9 TaxID=1576596 RepID=UPI000A4D97E8|nr:CbrC family protein [Pseudovibrio sp. POLY-S9]